MSDKAPVLDLDEALNRALEDVDFLKMMMEEFQASIPDFVGKINAAIDAADMHGLDEIATNSREPPPIWGPNKSPPSLLNWK